LSHVKSYNKPELNVTDYVARRFCVRNWRKKIGFLKIVKWVFSTSLQFILFFPHSVSFSISLSFLTDKKIGKLWNFNFLFMYEPSARLPRAKPIKFFLSWSVKVKIAQKNCSIGWLAMPKVTLLWRNQFQNVDSFVWKSLLKFLLHQEERL
jgi:hypothetical protein